MTNIRRSCDCGNSPKNIFAEDFTVGLLTGDRDFLVGAAAEGLNLSDVAEPPIEIVIDHVVTHGKAGAVNGTMVRKDGRSEGFCLMLTFASAKADRVARVSYYQAA